MPEGQRPDAPDASASGLTAGIVACGIGLVLVVLAWWEPRKCRVSIVPGKWIVAWHWRAVARFVRAARP